MFAILMISCSKEDEYIIQDNIVGKENNSSIETPATTIINEDEKSNFLLEKIHFKSTYFEIIEPSSVTFTVNEKLARLPLPIDAVLSTEDVKGSIDLEFSKSEISINLHTLKSDQSKRDNYVRNNLFPNQKFAYITINEFPSIPDNFTLGEKFDTTIKAIVNVNGVDALLDFDISAQLSFINPFYSDERLEIKGISEFYWSDFNMDTPKSGFFTLQDKVDVQISILADSLVVRY